MDDTQDYTLTSDYTDNIDIFPILNVSEESLSESLSESL